MGLLARFLRFGFPFLVRRTLRGVWMKGELPPGGFVWAANHHSWWDAFVAAAVLWQEGRELTVLMDSDNLKRFGFLRHLGVLGTSELRTALEGLRGGRVVVIFPEGALGPPGSLAPLERGASWLAAKASAPLVAVAVRLVLRGHEAPEAYLDAQEASPECLEATLGQRLAALDALIHQSDPRAPLPGFALVIRGRRSWDERLSGGRGARRS